MSRVIEGLLNVVRVCKLYHCCSVALLCYGLICSELSVFDCFFKGVFKEHDA